MTKLRVAAFQRAPIFDNAPQILRVLRKDLTWCNENDIHLAIFPECYLQGYATDVGIVSRRAVEVQSDLISQLRRLTEGFKTEVVLGFIERRNDRIFNTAMVVSDGSLVGSYSKRHPNEPAFEAGDTYSVFDIHEHRYGINICNDANYPESALAVSAQGANLLCYPLNNMLRPEVAEKWRSKSLDNLIARAKDTSCWIISSDVVGRSDGKISYGCTCIVSPAGLVVSRVDEGLEGVATFDIEKYIPAFDAQP